MTEQQQPKPTATGQPITPLTWIRRWLGSLSHAYTPGGGCFSLDCRVCGKPASAHRSPGKPEPKSRGR